MLSFVRGFNTGRQCNCAETLLVTLTDHNGRGALRFAMFGEGPRPALINEDEQDDEDDEEEEYASDNDEN